MLYGGFTMLIVVLILNKPVSFDFSPGYSLSLIYLAIFGSIISFSIYLKLLGEIGPDRSAYITLISPAIAMVFSTIFENYHWNLFGFAGIAFLFAGNYFVLRFKTQKNN
jgi:drug/metabolite transporter (DMT)-like permease